MNNLPNLILEKEIRKQGFEHIIGIDEVGRGPWAGPMYSTAVIIRNNLDIKNIKDSKKITEKKRYGIHKKLIQSNNLLHSTTSINSEQIDKLGLTESTHLLFKKNINKLITENGLNIDSCFALIDGNIIKSFPIHFKNIKKGDSISKSIATASIIAKVERDNYMVNISKKYPQFHFEKHKGYGTKLHQLALEKNGICPEHRLSFKPIKKYI